MENYTLNTESKDIVGGINELAVFSITDATLHKPGTIQVDASSALIQQYKDLCSAIEEDKIIRIYGNTGYTQVIMKTQITNWELFYMAWYQNSLYFLKFTIDENAIKGAVDGTVTCGEVTVVNEYNQIIS